MEGLAWMRLGKQRFYPLTSAYLEFPPGIELLQTFDRLLPVHAGCHSGTMLGRGSHAAVRAFKMCNLNIFISRKETLTEIHGCLRASAAVIRLDGLMVSILLMRSLASGVTVSHSGEGNYEEEKKWIHALIPIKGS